MKRTIALWLAAMLVAVLPCYAVVLVGFGQSAPPAGISDDFSSDTSANYTAITGGIIVSGGEAGGATNWADNIVWHETSLGSSDHFVQADITAVFSSTKHHGLIVRTNGTTGYFINLVDNERLNLFSINGTTFTFISYWDVTTPITVGTKHTVKVSISGSTLSAWVDAESLGTKTDSTYSAGEYVGISISRTDGLDDKIDNLSGESL